MKFLASFLFVGLFGCSAVNFTGSGASVANVATGTNGSTGGNATSTCTISNLSSTVPVKVLFVVDRSGSNAVETQNDGLYQCQSSNLVGCSPPTDPSLSFRGGSITSFFTANQSNPLFSWGFLAFSGTSAQSYILSNGSPSFGNGTSMQAAISQFYANTDGGATPYVAALSAAQNMIATDPDLSLTGAKAPLYEVIFLSDGFPTDAINTDGSVNASEIDSAISQIVGLAPGRVFFSSVYYGSIDDPVAASTLQSMATQGGGQFVNVDTQSISKISFNNIINIPSGDCKSN